MIKRVFSPKRRQTGFTLIEVLVYIVVLIIVVTAISSFLFWAVRINTKAKVVRETIDNARRAMEIIAYEIKESESIYEPTTVFDTNPGQLSLITKKYLPTGETETYLDFFITNDRLSLKKEALNPFYLTSDKVKVENLVFRKAMTGQIPSVQIELTVSYKNPDNKPEYQAEVILNSVASLRK